VSIHAAREHTSGLARLTFEVLGATVVGPREQNDSGALLPTAVIFFIGTVLGEFRAA
jgi:hypothetical protein